jgi:hypothetical protein
MKHTDINPLADEAANEAVRFIQERMNIPTGDFAALYFSGHRWEVLTNILAGYIVSEIIEGKSE